MSLVQIIKNAPPYSAHADVPLIQIKEHFEGYVGASVITGADLVEGWPFLLYNMGRMMEAAAGLPNAIVLHNAVKDVVATTIVTDTRFILPGTITMISSAKEYHNPNAKIEEIPFFDAKKRPILPVSCLPVLNELHNTFASALQILSADTEMGIIARIGMAAEDRHTPQYIAHYLKPALTWLDVNTPSGNAKKEIEKIGRTVQRKGIQFYGVPRTNHGSSPHSS